MHLGLLLYEVLLRLPKSYNLYLIASTFQRKRRVILQLAGYMSLKQWSPNYGPRARSGPLRLFIRPAELFLKNIYTHFEPQLDRSMSGIPQFQFFYLMFLENTPRFWEKNSEIRDRIDVKAFFLFLEITMILGEK